MNRGSHPQDSVKKGVIKNFAKFTKKQTPVPETFFLKSFRSHWVNKDRVRACVHLEYEEKLTSETGMKTVVSGKNSCVSVL